MALNIKNAAVERLVEEVARLSGESKTEAVRRALEERKARLAYRVAGDPAQGTGPEDVSRRGGADPGLRPGGGMILDTSAVVAMVMKEPGHEELLREYGTDYEAVRRYRIDPAVFASYFAGEYSVERLENAQVLDLRGVRGRLLSSSFTPGPDSPRRAPMLEALRRIFREHNEAGYVRLEYRVEMVCGQLEPVAIGAGR